MEFYIASDLHYGVNKRGNTNTEALARHVCENPTDALIIAGDIGSDPETLAMCLSLFEGFEGRKLAVPGNHDVWTKGWQTSDSWTIHETLMPDLLEAHGFAPLHLDPVILDEVAFVGSMGWYDYTFRDEIGIDIEHYRSKTPPWSSVPIWSDARYANFQHSDEELTALLVKRLAHHLSQVPKARQVVGVVHHVVTKPLLVHPREMVPKLWRYANAFLGSERFGDLLRGDPRVVQVFCGHIHMERSCRWPGCACTCVGGNYKVKQLLRASPQKVLEKLNFDS